MRTSKNFFDFIDDYDDTDGLPLYHGTVMEHVPESTVDLLAPIDTGVFREDFRTKHQNVVFATNSLKSAWSYAYKAKNKFGGSPVVYRVIMDPHSIQKISQTEFIANYATIINKI